MRMDPSAWPKMVEVAACLGEQMVAAQSPSVCGIFLLPGAIPALGDYAEGGIGWVRLAGGGAGGDDEQFTIRTASGSTCNATVQFLLEVGIARCAPVGDGPTPPTVAEWMSTTAVQMTDMDVIRRTIACCASDLELGTYNSLGPQGGMVGGFWTAEFRG